MTGEKLIERLREHANNVTGPKQEAWTSRDLLNKAANALSAQHQEIERLRSLVREPAALRLPEDPRDPKGEPLEPTILGSPPYRWAIGDDFIRRARAALNL